MIDIESFSHSKNSRKVCKMEIKILFVVSSHLIHQVIFHSSSAVVIVTS